MGNLYSYILEARKRANSRYIKFPRDLVINNIGERKDGKIIFFDI